MKVCDLRSVSCHDVKRSSPSSSRSKVDLSLDHIYSIEKKNTLIIIILIINVLIVQYPISNLLEILANHVQHRFAQAIDGSTNTTRVHALHA